ncbi:MAG: metallophosphoesterase family protein [Chloroflexota bacterium]
MRLALLSDIHGNLAAFEAVLADLEAQGGADNTWFLGDHAAFGPRPAECVQRVKAMIDAVKDDEAKKHTVRAIRGNTDRWLVYGQRPKWPAAKDAEALPALRDSLRDMSRRLEWCLDQLSFDEYDFLHKLGGEIDTNVESYGWVIGYHGSPGDDESVALLPDSSDEEAADALLDREGRLGVGGHTHRQMDRTVGSWRVINVGSVGFPFDNNAGKAQYGIFTFENGDVQVDLRNIDYDFESVIADSEARGNPATEWLTKTLRGSS